ncbi:unnamed protein product [Mortierella alpina]
MSNCVKDIPDAVHFMKNLEEFPTWLVEFSTKCDKDYVNIIRAWDYVAQMGYEVANERNEYPLNVAMEARFNKASSCIMSPMYDEDPEALFFSIELFGADTTQRRRL